jgi:hypothetical protein
MTKVSFSKFSVAGFSSRSRQRKRRVRRRLLAKGKPERRKIREGRPRSGEGTGREPVLVVADREGCPLIHRGNACLMSMLSASISG